MTVGEIADLFEEIAPKSAALSWDNPGLLVGSRSWTVGKVYIALDCTDEVIDHAIEAGADLIVTHHPLIFSPVKSVVAEDFIGKRIIRMIEHRIALFAMHTNFDICRMGPLVAGRLNLSDMVPLVPCGSLDASSADAGTGGFACGSTGLGGIGTLETDMTLEQLSLYVKKSLGLPGLKTFGDQKMRVHRIAFLPGSGKSDIDTAIAAGADCYITGDVDHHSGIDAVEKGIAVIDAGHWGMEHFFIEYVDLFLKGRTAGLLTATEPYVSPFAVY